MHVSNQAPFDTTLLKHAIAHRYELAQQVKLIEAEMKKLSDEILGALREQDLDSFKAEDLVATIVTTTRHTLSERKLLERGVPMSVIQESKTENTSRYVQVRKQNEDPA